MKKYLIVVCLIILGTPVFGHVDLLSPKGTETYSVGTVLSINWEETIPHSIQNWDILFSVDDGQTWDTIQADIDVATFHYEWTVPNTITNRAKIQVVQDNDDSYMDYYGISGIFTILPNSLGQGKLFIPSVLSGEEINLSFQKGQVAFLDGIMTNTYGYNQDYLGPTLLLNKGDAVRLNVTNNLSETTTVHWHGMHVSPENDGGPHTPIKAGETWSPSFTVLDNAATYWYHPHLHEHTEEQVTKGGAGFIIVKDQEETQLELPRTYGIDDIPIVIQSRAFDSNKQLLSNTAADDVILTNGTLDAFFDIPAQVVRFRLLNGSTERVYNLGFEDNLNFFQIASDGGLLNAPVSLTRLQLAPGERVEILVDLSTHQGQSINLISFSSELPSGTYGASNPSVMPMGSIAGYNNNPLNGSDFTILQLNIAASTTNPITSIPVTLINNTPYSQNNINTSRSLTFQPAQMGPNGMLNGPFVINGAGFNQEVVNYEIPLNNLEIWELRNQTAIAHPFHIHDVQFYILDINGQTPPPNMQGRKDVVLVPPMNGTVRFIAKFDDFANKEVPYMYHCHMLSHEDDGMMGQFIVFGNTTSTIEEEKDLIYIYPNPTADNIQLTGLSPAIIELYSTSGHLLERRESANIEEQFSLNKYAAGVYYFNIITQKSSRAYKAVKE